MFGDAPNGVFLFVMQCGEFFSHQCQLVWRCIDIVTNCLDICLAAGTVVARGPPPPHTPVSEGPVQLPSLWHPTFSHAHKRESYRLAQMQSHRYTRNTTHTRPHICIPSPYLPNTHLSAGNIRRKSETRMYTHLHTLHPPTASCVSRQIVSARR